MPEKELTVSDLTRILFQSAGTPEGIAPGTDIQDTEFEALGYDSLAILETISRVEREYGIPVDECLATQAITPRAFVEAVNAQGHRD